MYAEEDLLPISALQHLAFCERQWGLIYLENMWDENPLTVEGKHLHNRADSAETEVRGDVRITRGLRLRSLRLGLTGKADVVEFYRVREPSGECIHIEGIAGLWRPVPVEYKRGKPKIEPCDEFQLCAQALCLEEMTGAKIPEGMLYYGVPRRRYDVVFDQALRQKTEELCVRLHELTKEGKTPKPEYSKQCRSCSLIDRCMPKAIGKQMKVEIYLAGAFSESLVVSEANEEGTSDEETP